MRCEVLRSEQEGWGEITKHGSERERRRKWFPNIIGQRSPSQDWIGQIHDAAYGILGLLYSILI